MGNSHNVIELTNLVIPSQSIFSFSEKSKKDLLALVKQLDTETMSTFTQAKIDFDEFRNSIALVKEVYEVRDKVKSHPHFVLIESVNGINTVVEQAAYTWLISNILGETMIQDSNNNYMIEVFNREKNTIENGARYHQTKQGAYIHNDGVSYEEPIDYLILSCVNSAYIGGESILIDIMNVEKILHKNKRYLSILQQEFWFEKRGITEKDEFFKFPIISYTSDEKPIIRYFRTYIESAHKKIGEPLSSTQTQALDFLDAVIDQIEVQYRMLLKPGQMLVSSDKHLLHTRTNFIDNRKSPLSEKKNQVLDKFNRYMFRVWARNRTNEMQASEKVD